ncbi:MAG: NAD(P)/FAD-dependent oxidoreductase [Chloroflexota bacterium]
MEHHEAVVIGAGHAGLAASQRLAAAGIDHLVLERGRIGETWRSQRWDTFALNTPSWANRLPGDTDDDVLPPADAFHSATVFAGRLAGYAARWGLPVHERTAVDSVSPRPDGFEVGIAGTGAERLRARSVVVASGIQNVPRLPPIAAELPGWVTQLHSLAYRDPVALPEGAVLVVGGGQTGGQIVEDLLEAGRRVYLAPSNVPRMPRRYRGRDIFEWLTETGFWDVRPEQLPDPAMVRIRQPLISGVGRLGHTVSLQWLAARGATLVGRIRAVEADALLLDDTVGACIRFGDTWSATIARMIDAAVEAAGAALPEREDDPADEPHPDPDSVHSPERMDLRALGITTVIWATGVRGDFSWLPAHLVDADGGLVQQAGRTPLPGLFALGFPWLTRRGSGVIAGITPDAQLVADAVAARAT